MNLDGVISRLIEFARRPRSCSSHPNTLDAGELHTLATSCRDVFMSQPMLLEVSPPLKVAGDIHGQFQDLVRIFDLCGPPPASNYLFLGDYVDRGRNGVESIALLFALKLKYPDNFFLLRGNHECAQITRVYGFYDECKRRYSVKLWKTIVEAFNCMPVACVIDDKIFCAHGGLSPALQGVNQIRKIARPCEVPEHGVMCDLLWSDPSDDIQGWAEGDRGVSFLFGPDIVSKFLELNDLDLICRAHQVVEDGYQFFAQRRLVTIFSAPNYVGEFDNAGAVMSVDEDLTCSFHVLRPVLKKPHL